MTTPSTDTVQSATEWSCDDKLGKCRNTHGCHCREISDLQSELTRAREREREAFETCAKVCEDTAKQWGPEVGSSANEAALKIRALAGGKP